MADKFIVIKNGLVLTLDRKKQAGYYNVVIRNGKIFFVDHENKFNEQEFKSKNPDAEFIDAKDKLIMPGFFNSKSVSVYSLNKFFLKKCSYENMSQWVSLKLIDNYLSKIETAETLRDLLKINYHRSIQNGEVFLNESSFPVKKDFYDIYFLNRDWIRQYYNLTVFDYTILNDDEYSEGMFSMGFRIDEDVNNYSLSSLKKYLSGNKIKLSIEASLSQKSVDSIKKIFGKPFVNVLSENDLISANTILYNPTYFSQPELEILAKKNSTVLICPSDYINLSPNKIDFDELIQSGIKIIIGTGYTGNDVLSELKIFSTLISKSSISYSWLLEAAILNPSAIFGISNVTGSIDRNKSADLIFYDLKDLRNTLTLPEINSEDLCEFIICNLTAKDISDVLLKGEFLVREKKVLINDPEDMQIKAKEISSKIFSAGKYFEFKEKYLMRDRVDKLYLNNKDEETEEVTKEEIFVDMTETGEYTGEGEFTIIGAKEEEFEKPWSKEKEEKDHQVNVKEIKSLEKDLNLFEEEYDTQKIQKPKTVKKEPVKEKTFKELHEDRFTKKPDDMKERKTEAAKSVETSDAQFQKGKLKFGFKEED